MCLRCVGCVCVCLLTANITHLPCSRSFLILTIYKILLPPSFFIPPFLITSSLLSSSNFPTSTSTFPFFSDFLIFAFVIIIISFILLFFTFFYFHFLFSNSSSCIFIPMVRQYFPRVILIFVYLLVLACCTFRYLFNLRSLSFFARKQ